MGIPDEPFWAPAELVEAYREHAAARGAAVHDAVAGALRRRRRSTTAAWDACWDADRHRRMGRRPADVRAGREDRHPRGDREGVQRHARRSCPASSPAPPTSPATPAPSSPASRRSRTSTPAGRQIHYGIREHAMGSTMVGMARARRRAPRRRHVLRVPRLHAPAGAPRRAQPGQGAASSSPTTRSASARTARRTSRSSSWPRCGRSPACRSSARPTPTRPSPRWRAAVEHDGPTALVLSRQNVPVVHRRLGRRPRRRRRA